MTRSPVLFLVFNRPKQTAQVFEAIRAANPPRLYVAADGPRPDREDEAAICDEVRRIATQVDWPCEVKTLFRERNLGCGLAPAGAITWFFEHEEQGIILEDDCLPHITFFRFCDELLDRYREDMRIMSIAGNNIQGEKIPTQFSYLFSKFSLMWGWATWRRAWQLYDRQMTDWPRLRTTDWLYSIGAGGKPFKASWSRIFDMCHEGRDDIWDYQWIYSCWREHGLTILPANNLVSNIGFGEDATHTFGNDPLRSNLSATVIEFPLKHPRQIEVIYEADAFIARHWFKISWMKFLKQYLSTWTVVRWLISIRDQKSITR